MYKLEQQQVPYALIVAVWAVCPLSGLEDKGLFCDVLRTCYVQHDLVFPLPPILPQQVSSSDGGSSSSTPT